MNECELPSQIKGILDSDIEALSASGAVDMSGIAAEEHKSLSHSGDDPSMDREHRSPEDILDRDRNISPVLDDFF